MPPKLKEMVPSLGVKLSENPELFHEVWDHGTKVLGLASGAVAASDPEPAGMV